MRLPINPLPTGMRQRITSVAASFTVDVFELQPGSAGTGGSVPIGRLPTVPVARLDDDASQAVARTMTLPISSIPLWLKPGMWIQATVGIQILQPIIYRLPSLIITNVGEDLSQLGGGTVTAQDPGAVLNGRPYEVDTTLSGTLRSMVAAACSASLTRVTDVSGVPDIAVPVGTVAEFGAGRWDTCLSTGDALGYALRFTDPGDVVATDRSAAPPAPAAVVERCLTEGGASNHVRSPTAARVLVTRGSDTPGLVGNATTEAITGTVPPPWYLPYVVSDRQEGDANTTQTQADALAANLLKSRLADLDTFEDMPILPAPWLEAGVDVVSFYGRRYLVRAVRFEFPSLATFVTLRRIFP